MTGPRQRLSLYHDATGRTVPVEVLTVFGRNDRYYRYTDSDERPERLNTDVADGLAAHNYVQISSDSQISRTHGLIDPGVPGVCDLNSTNGTYLNSVVLPTRKGREGPTASIDDGDMISLGKQVFRVNLKTVSEADLALGAAKVRFGLVASDPERRTRAERVQQFLTTRKSFTLQAAADWPGVISAAYSLQQTAAVDGLAVCSLTCSVAGTDLSIGGEAMPLEKLLTVFQEIPGRKVIALDVDGDPTACELAFEATAHEDMVLLTAPRPVELDDEAFHHSARSATLDQMRESVAGDSLPGAFDDVVDGLDALIQADSNILMISWIATYQGRLKVSFGTRQDTDDRAISHSLRYGSTTFRF